MKQLITFLLIFTTVTLFSQSDIKTNGIFYKVSAAATLTVNEDYTLTQDDDTGPFLIPNALFITNTLGYQFDERTSLGVNLEFDHHFENDLLFFPAYLSFRYNLITNDNNLFLRTSYGRLLNIAKNFETGTLYKVGLGIQSFDDNYKNSLLFGIDFSRKRFGYKQDEKLSSISIFFEFMLF